MNKSFSILLTILVDPRIFSVFTKVSPWSVLWVIWKKCTHSQHVLLQCIWISATHLRL